jgi:hypothetical protein
VSNGVAGDAPSRERVGLLGERPILRRSELPIGIAVGLGYSGGGEDLLS